MVQIERHRDSDGVFVRKGGAEKDVGAPHILKIEQEDGNPPRLVARQIQLTHKSSIGDSVTPQFHEKHKHVVLLHALDFAHWKKGIFRLFRITFRTWRDAEAFVAVFETIAGGLEAHSSERNEELAPVVLSSPPVAVDNQGECPLCPNVGVIGEVCDNCGSTIEPPDECSDVGTRSSNDEEDSYGVIENDCSVSSSGEEEDFANTQDDTGQVFRPDNWN